MASKPETDEVKIRKVIDGGAIMTQVAICRFLVNEGIIDRGKLVAWIDAKRVLWEQSAGPAGGAAARILLAGISAEREPEFPKTLH
jgi:hypothetical protein